MNKYLRKHPKHIQVALNASLIVRFLAYTPLLFGIFLLPEQNKIAIILTVIMIFVWTPLAFFLATTNKKPIKMEFINLCIEAAIVGFIIPLTDFNPIFILVVVVITGMGGIAYGGLSLCLKRYLSLGLGLGICIPFVGINYNYEPSLNTVAIMGLSVLFSTFTISYGSLKGAKQAVKTSKELKEKKTLLEENQTQLEEKASELENKTTELERITKDTAKYLSPQVYDSIVLGKKEVRIETYRKKLTIFFCDIKDFTETTDSMESEALASLLNNYLNEMAEIALRHGGHIDKFIGDSILIFFGDPESKGEAEDAEACVLMAIEMRERMKYLHKKWSKEGITKPLHIRCGINTGFCTVGNFGSENRMDHTIIGGQVNLASRLEENAESDQILISENTYALVKDKIHCDKRDEIKVKGIAHPCQTYQVIDLQENLTKDRAGIDKEIKSFLEKMGNDELSSIDKDYIVEKIANKL